MKKRDLYLAIGSNLGDRRRNVETAILLLEKSFRQQYKALSPVNETTAIGFDGPDFLNCIVVFSTTVKPERALEICKSTEARMGRSDEPEYAADGSRIYHSRIIDIDILKYGEIVVQTPNLTIPHPQVESRAYIKELLLNL